MTATFGVAYEAGVRAGLVAAADALADTGPRPPHARIVVERRGLGWQATSHTTERIALNPWAHWAWTRRAAIGAAVAALPATFAITLEEAQ